MTPEPEEGVVEEPVPPAQRFGASLALAQNALAQGFPVPSDEPKMVKSLRRRSVRALARAREVRDRLSLSAGIKEGVRQAHRPIQEVLGRTRRRRRLLQAWKLFLDTWKLVVALLALWQVWVWRAQLMAWVKSLVALIP